MAFRNENVALRTKVQQLQSELERLRAEVTGEETTPSSEIEPDEIDLPQMAKGRDVAVLVARRAAEEAAARRASESSAERARSERAAQYAKRPTRVSIERLPDATRVHIAPKLLRDGLREDSEWHFWFFLINPGIFITMGFSAALFALFDLHFAAAGALGFLLWVAVLALGNVVYARMSNPRHTFDLMKDGHFALYAGQGPVPALFGHASELEVRLSDGDKAELGSVRFTDRRSKVELTKLSPKDIATLKTVLGRFVS